MIDAEMLFDLEFDVYWSALIHCITSTVRVHVVNVREYCVRRINHNESKIDFVTLIENCDS